MRIYKTLPDLERRKQMALWHKALKIDWSPKDVDFSAPGVLGKNAHRNHLARVLSPILVGEQAGLYSITSIIRALGRTSEVEGQFFLSTMLVDEAKHVELFTHFYRRIEREPMSIRRFPAGYLFQTAVLSEDPVDWLTGSLVSEVLAKMSLEELRRIDLDPVLGEMCDRILEDETRHLGFNHLFLAERCQVASGKGKSDADAMSEHMTTRLEHVLSTVPAILEGLEPDLRELGMQDRHTFFERLRDDCRRRLAKSIDAGERDAQSLMEAVEADE